MSTDAGVMSLEGFRQPTPSRRDNSCVYPLMIRQRSGHIVNAASLAGLGPAPLLVPYAATKHAVVGLSNVGVIVLPASARLSWRLGRWAPSFVEKVLRRELARERAASLGSDAGV